MSQKTSVEHQSAGSGEKPESEAFVYTASADKSSDEATRLSELILKAALLWQSKPKQCQNGTISSEKPISITEHQTLILKSLANLGPSKPSIISKVSRLSQPTVQRRLKELIAAGLVTKSGQTKGVSYALPKTQK